MTLAGLLKGGKPVIGMLHLLPLPGSPRFAGDQAAILRRLLSDAEILVAGGVHALLLENFGDVPFFPGPVPSHVVAHMTRMALEVRTRFPVPLGINVLRNDGISAMGIAHAVGARFIRVNVLTGARVSDQGVLQGIAHQVARVRSTLAAGDVLILADIRVKHSAPLADRPLDEEVSETLERGGADALIVTGAGTGRPASVSALREVQDLSGDAPVLVGSGVTPQSIASLAPHADGFIVGTSIKVDGRVENPVDPARVKALMLELQGLA